MAVSAVYPNGILPWTPRVDNQDTVWAKDPNQLAAEIMSIEGTLGTNPHVESSTPTGASVSYSNVSGRIHDVQMGNQNPSVTLATSTFYVPYTGNVNTIADVPGYLNSYALFGGDGFGFFNGTDITLPASGWYTVFASQRVWWAASGTAQMTLWFQDGAQVSQDVWHWNFPTNNAGGAWGTHNKHMRVFWQGWLPAGMRISVYTWNGTSNNPMKVDYGRIMVKWDQAG